MDSTLYQANWKRNQDKDLTSTLKRHLRLQTAVTNKTEILQSYIIRYYVNRCDSNFIYYLYSYNVNVIKEIWINSSLVSVIPGKCYQNELSIFRTT